MHIVGVESADKGEDAEKKDITYILRKLWRRLPMRNCTQPIVQNK